MRIFPIAPLSLAIMLAGCDLAPRYVRPMPPAPAAWPTGAAYDAQQPGTAGMPWRTLISDPKLQQVVELALANNRDLRATIANVASARAQYRVERSYQLPTVGLNSNATIQGQVNGSSGTSANFLTSDSYSGNLGVSSFEIDLFGRLRNQSRAAFEAYLGTQSGMRSARIALVSETATAYATLASDMDTLSLATTTMAAGERTLALTQSLLASGLASDEDVQNAITIVEQVKSDVASGTTLVAQDRNALNLLAGAPVAEALLPQGLADLDRLIGNVPAGLSSDVLLQRPDVVEAEHQLKGANASIGAARVAFFPSISLTSGLGVASTALSSLFTGGALRWSVSPTANMPLFGGPNSGNLEYAKAQRDLYLAQYERAIQAAFSDVANGLARRGTIGDQRRAQWRLVMASDKAYGLAQSRYQAGVGSFLDVLTAQRSLYASQRTQVATILTDIGNRVTLYRAIGSDDSL